MANQNKTKTFAVMAMIFLSLAVAADEKEPECMDYQLAKGRILQQVEFGIKLQEKIKVLQKENEELRKQVAFYHELNKSLYKKEFN